LRATIFGRAFDDSDEDAFAIQSPWRWHRAHDESSQSWVRAGLASASGSRRSVFMLDDVRGLADQVEAEGLERREVVIEGSLQLRRRRSSVRARASARAAP
jgi:hypothetical protein